MHDRVRAVIAQTFEVPEEQVPDDAEIYEVAGWDSLGHVTLMLTLESEFGVELPTEQMLKLTSLGAIVEHLKQTPG